MSAIYGYISLNGRPLNPESLFRLREMMEDYPHDASFYREEEGCMLGQILRWDTPESLHEHFPLMDEGGNIVFVAAGRIDNREELFRLLKVPHLERPAMTDGRLMFLSYCTWGRDACNRLLGDWSFSAWHKKEKKLFIGRDHAGIMAVYYHQGKDFLVFSSSLKVLLCLPEVPKDIDELRVAQILTAWPGDGEATCYRHILNLKPGHFLEVQEGRVTKTMFWELTEQPELILPREEDYYERFRELFSEAVRTRLRSYSNVGIMLSGGYDSTSVAAVAALELARQNKELYAFTSVPYYTDCRVPPGRIANEGPLAASLARKYPNIRHFLIDAAGYPVLGSVDKAVEMLGEPLHAAGNQYWNHAIYDTAEEHSVRVLLNAQGGNGVISWPTGKPRLFAKKGLPLLKYRVKMALTDLHTLVKNPEHLRYPFLDYSFISREFVRKFGIREKMKAAGHDPKFRKHQPLKQAQRELMTMCFLNAYSIHYRISLGFGITSADPSGHVPLLLFMLSVPEKVYRVHDYRRVFVEKAMRELLPEEIITARGKGLQAADLLERIGAEIRSLPDLSFSEQISGILDEKRFVGTIRKKSDIGEMAGINHNNMVYWLRAYSIIKMKGYEYKKNSSTCKKTQNLA